MKVSFSMAGFRRCEDGSAPFFILWFCVLAFVAGIALDTANAWRHKQILQQTADVAAHSGTVALAEGLSNEEVVQRVTSSIETHLSPGSYGPVMSGPENISILDYNHRTSSLAATGALRNAVSVTLQRDESVGNPVNLLLLRIGSVFGMGDRGFNSWQIRARSISVVAPTSLCATSDMIHAAGTIHLTANQSFGSGYCVHSQSSVWLPSRNRFAEGSVLSMPDLEYCQNKCSDSANPGAGAAAREMNMPVPDIDAHISKIEGSLLFAAGPTHEAFFASRPISGDTSVMEDAGILHRGARRGDVVEISAGDFNSLEAYPSGLTYDVSCEGKYPDRLEKKSKKGSSSTGYMNFDGVFEDLAIVSDCSASFSRGTVMRGSLVVLTNDTAGISADSKAEIGDPTGGCRSSERTTILSRGDLRVPAGFATSNVSLVMRGDVKFAGSAGSSTHRGLSIVTEGSIHLSAGHSFQSCNMEPANQPRSRVIRHIAERALPGA